MEYRGIHYSKPFSFVSFLSFLFSFLFSSGTSLSCKDPLMERPYLKPCTWEEGICLWEPMACPNLKRNGNLFRELFMAILHSGRLQWRKFYQMGILAVFTVFSLKCHNGLEVDVADSFFSSICSVMEESQPSLSTTTTPPVTTGATQEDEAVRSRSNSGGMT